MFEFDEMFIVLWNNQQMDYWNIAHCNKFDEYEEKYVSPLI